MPYNPMKGADLSVAEADLSGGVPIASGGYGCVFDPALKCEDPKQPYDPNLISKLMVKRHGESEKKEILKFAPILSKIPNAEKYFILNINSCTPAPLSSEDLKDYDAKCNNFRNKPEFRAANMRKKHVLNELLILNMLNGGVDLDAYLSKKPVDAEKIYNVVYGIKDLINNAILPMNKLGVYHLDLKPANIVIDRNNQMRIIDWGLSDIIKDTSQLTRMLPKSVQFNNPFYMVLADQRFLSMYNHFVRFNPDPERNMNEIARSYYKQWEQKRGEGHTRYIHMLMNELKKSKRHHYSIVDIRYTIIESLIKALMVHTNYKKRIFDYKEFMRTLYHNIDLWGALITFALFFFKNIEDEITLSKKDKKEFLKQTEALLDKYLFNNFKKIDVVELNKDLDNILLIVKPHINLSPDIKITVPPTSDRPVKKTKTKKRIILNTTSTGELITVSSSPKSIKVTKKHPRCPNGYRRNPKTGQCELKTKKKQSAKKSAKKQSAKKATTTTVLNSNVFEKQNMDFSQFLELEKERKDKNKTSKNKASKNPTQKKQRKPRCPNGTRRNSKTGKCDPKK